MAGELFKLAAKVDLLFVPYKGEGPAIADALGGQISMVFSNLPVGMGAIVWSLAICFLLLQRARYRQNSREMITGSQRHLGHH